MQIVYQNPENIQYQGQALDQALAAQLAFYDANSHTAQAMLNTTNGNPVTIVIKTNVPFATAVRRVTAKAGIIAGNLPEKFKEFCESVVFETTNATNSALFAQADNQFAGGQITLHQFGRARSDIEAESSWTVAQMIQELVAVPPPPVPYAPSAWGQGHVTAVQGSLTLAAYQGVFSTLPHDANATGLMNLLSPEMYAFNKIQEVKIRINDYLDIAVTARKSPPGKFLSFAKLKNSLSVPHQAVTNTTTNGAAVWYCLCIELCKDLASKPGWTVTWNGGNVGGWEFTNPMKQLAQDNQGVLTALKQKASSPTQYFK